MIRSIIAFMLLWLGLELESSLFQVPPINLIQPNLVLIVLIVVAATQGARSALILGVLIGALQDIEFAKFIGINAFTYGFVGYFAATLFGMFLQRNVAITLLVTVVFTFIQEWLTYGLTRLFDVTAYGLSTAMTKTLWQMLINGVFLLVLYPALSRVLTSKRRTLRDSEGKSL